MVNRFTPRSCFLLALALVLLVPASAWSTEFVANGGLTRALAPGSRCEYSSNSFNSWTLTTGATWYDDDALKTNSQGCPGATTLTIVQSFAIPGNLPYTLSFSHNENQWPNPGTVVWNIGWAKGNVYYYSDAGQTTLIGSATTGNVTAAARNTWTTATMTKTTPANCVSARLEVIAYSTSGGGYYGFTNVDDISLTGCIPITVTSHPASLVRDVGQTATFSVTVTGESPVYLWEKKPSGGSFAPISGAINPNYTTGALALTDSGDQYRCKVTNSCTTAYSNAANLTVISPTVVSTIAQAKTHADGAVIRLPEKPVSARTSTAYWIEDTNPPSGIKIASAAYPAAGSKVAVTGTMRTAAGERRIDPLTEDWGTAGSEVKPYFLTTRSLGGAGLCLNAPGVDGGFGANNLGLFVKIDGIVTQLGADYYYVDDGASYRDGTLTGSQPNVGVRVLAAPGSLASGNWVAVMGISSAFASGLNNMRAIVPPGCTQPLTGLAVGALSSAVCSGQSTSITVAGAETGVTCQLRNNSGNTAVGSPVAGTGGTINLPTGILTSTTTFNVLATRNVGGCSAQLAQTKTITVNPLPNASLAVGAQQTQLDVGQSTNVTVASSQAGVNYQLRKHSDNSNVGSPVAGTGGTILLPTGAYTQTGTYTYNVLATNAITGCTQQLTQTVTITVGQLGNLTGRVMNARGEPLNGAAVTLSSGGYSTTTSAGGYYTFNNVVAGTYGMTASASTYQSHTWERVIVTANRTNPVASFYLCHTWSKIGWHIQKDNTPRLSEDFFLPIRDCGKTCQMVKCMGVLGKSETAVRDCPGSFSVGRVNDVDGVGDIQAFDAQWAAGVNPADHAWFVYYGTQKPTQGSGGLKRLMQLNRSINVWEINNEWDAHYDWQADYTLAMMDLAEADGYRIAAFSSASGTPSLDPNYKFPGDTRTELENLARVCARAKAHGGHMLALHEYCYDGTLQSCYTAAPGALVGRYRLYHDYLKNYAALDDPANGWVGADCPIIITESVGDCSAGCPLVVADMAWYDSLVRQDSYLLGVATWNIGWECDLHSCFLAMSDYECTVN